MKQNHKNLAAKLSIVLLVASVRSVAAQGSPGIVWQADNAGKAIAFSPVQQIIAAGSGDRVYDGVVRFWRLSDGVLLRFFNQDPNNLYSYVTGVAYSPDGRLVAFARADGLVVVARPFRSRF